MRLNIFMRWIDALLNKVTMYSFMLLFLVVLVIIGIALAFVGVLPYNPWLMILNVGAFYGFAKVFNFLAGRVFKVRPNSESSAITGLILALIFPPNTPLEKLWLIAVVVAIAVLSKFIIIIHRRHLFNPAAFAAVVSAIVFNFGAGWWVGSSALVPIVLIGGLLFLRKMRWAHLAFSFFGVYLAAQLGLFLFKTPDGDILNFIYIALIYSPILFFGFVMLTEPLTMPTGKRVRMAYGAGVALIAVFLPLIFEMYYSLELSLLVANILGLLVFGNTRRFLKFLAKEKFAENGFIFSFTPNQTLAFEPGQFLLWSLSHDKADSRGHRRYFSIASSPTEKNVMILTKFANKSSSFKSAIRQLAEGAEIMATGLDGDFTLPKNREQALVFIAGGVGIAPFRSMIKYLLDTHQSQPITLFYSNNRAEDVGLKDLLDSAAKTFGLKTVYTLSDVERVPAGWQGRVGLIDAEMIKTEVADYARKVYYVSGPDPMVRSMEKILRGLSIPKSQIKTDYFPGYI